MSVLVVTGTGTGVGKTIATAALASRARQAGIDVAVCKPIQTGTAAGDDDLAVVRRLSGAQNLVGSWRYPEPLAPVAAAQRSALPLPVRVELDVLVRAVDRSRQLTLVEGAGGLLVQLGSDGTTLRELAVDLHAPALVVTSPELGTLNHTALTLEALDSHGISCAGLIIGAWPAEPGALEESNRAALARLAPLRAVLAAGAGELSVDEFARLSVAEIDGDWLAELVV